MKGCPEQRGAENKEVHPNTVTRERVLAGLLQGFEEMHAHCVRR